MRIKLLSVVFGFVTMNAFTAQAQFTYATNNGAITITGYTGSDSAIEIPSTINGLTVSTIASYAFNNAANLTSAAMPDTLLEIGRSAFEGTGLSEVVIPAGVTNIGAAAFFNCSNLVAITIPDSVVYLGGGAFSGCGSMTSASIGNGVPEILHDTFSYCNLDHVTIGSSVTYIDSWAFGTAAPSDHLRGIYFRGDAPDFNSSAFYNNTSIVVFYLPGTAGWDRTYDGYMTFTWNPEILTDDPTHNFGVGADGFEFTVHTRDFNPAGNYITVVEACTNLSEGNWMPLQTNVPVGYVSYFEFNDPQWTNYPVRLYRVDMP